MDEQRKGIRDERQATFNSHAEWFQAFLRHTDQKSNTLKMAIHGIEQIPSLSAKLKDKKYQFSALYVGVGNGKLEIPLTRWLTDARGNQQNISIYNEDPSHELKQQFLSGMERQGLGKVVVEYSMSKFEDPLYKPVSADLLIASHVGYYIPDWADEENAKPDNSLVKFTQAIKEGGLGLIVLQSEQSDNFAIRSIWSPKIHGTSERTGEQTVKTLKKLEIDHKTEIIESITDVTPCFQNSTFNPTPEGELLLEFILRTNWKNLDPTTQQQVGEQLSRITEKNLTSDGRRIMKFRDVCIWIPGQQIFNP